MIILACAVGAPSCAWERVLCWSSGADRGAGLLADGCQDDRAEHAGGAAGVQADRPPLIGRKATPITSGEEPAAYPGRLPTAAILTSGCGFRRAASSSVNAMDISPR